MGLTSKMIKYFENFNHPSHLNQLGGYMNIKVADPLWTHYWPIHIYSMILRKSLTKACVTDYTNFLISTRYFTLYNLGSAKNILPPMP